MQLRLDAIRSNLHAILVHSRCNLDAVKISVKIESTDKVKAQSLLFRSGGVGGWLEIRRVRLYQLPTKLKLKLKLSLAKIKKKKVKKKNKQRYEQMSTRKMLLGQMTPGQLTSGEYGPRNLPSKFGQLQVSKS